jgi:hypothetical protein
MESLLILVNDSKPRIVTVEYTMGPYVGDKGKPAMLLLGMALVVVVELA